jgi:succinate dehydrogenase / fumarate reductase, cytochrome b subunit
VGNPLVKLILFGLLWAYLHHFCAGIRFLLLDLHKGIDLQPARNSARLVLIVSLALTAVIGVALW